MFYLCDMNTQKYWGKTIASFMLVLFTMPLGHALMRVMEDTMSVTALHYSAFAMGAVGLAIVIWGVFVKGDVKQTFFGLFGGLLFWTGWVEFLFGYFAARFGCPRPFLRDGRSSGPCQVSMFLGHLTPSRIKNLYL